MINLTIQSVNNKSIAITNLDTFNKVHSNISNNYSVSLDYSNYIVEIATKTSSLSLDNFWINLNLMTKTTIFIVVSIFLIFAISYSIKYFKRL